MNKLKKEDNGIKMKRSCTDCCCCMVFAAFLVTLFGISMYGFARGDPYALLTPYDSVGNKCGSATAIGGDYSSYKYKYFVNLDLTVNVSSLSYDTIFDSVCVAVCPWDGKQANCMPNTDSPVCPTPLGFSTSTNHLYCLPNSQAFTEGLQQIYK